jgi:acyl-CoA reductase-like NAD-dependent aldehyde dehydrogenase
VSDLVVVDPATGHEIARVPASDDADVDAAVAAARTAQPAWAALPHRERARLLRRLAEAIRAEAPSLAALLSRENGKPARDAEALDLAYAPATFELFAGLIETIRGEIVEQGPIETHVLPEPYGVIAAVLPFNWPPIHFAAKCAPALAAGNTVVLKPGDQAPLTVLRLVEIAATVLPPGVVTVVTGLPAGRMLVAHAGVDRISFTGSPETGRRVLEAAASRLIPATMELGGKNALIVYPDADLDRAVAAAVEGGFFNQGEACTATSRILLHHDVYDAFAARFADATRRLIVGRGTGDVDVGPLVDAVQRDRVLAHIDRARAQGAVVLAEAELPADPALHGGFWVAPTVLGDVTSDMAIATEEVFGPVVTLHRFGDDEEAVQLANGTDFGLTAAVFTADAARARRIAGRLEAGMVFVNNYFRASLLGTPFGGVKHSGFGREGAPETLREFTRSKSVRYAPDPRAVPLWIGARRPVEAQSAGST